MMEGNKVEIYESIRAIYNANPNAHISHALLLNLDFSRSPYERF